MHLEIQVGKGTANLAGPCLNRVKEDPRVFWDERGANPSIGKLTRQFQVFRPQCCQIDRQVWSRLCIWDQRLTLSSRQGQLIDLTRIAQALTACDHPHNIHCFSRALQRTCKAHAMPALHHLWSAYSQPQEKSIMGESRHRQSRHANHGRCA